MNDDMIQFDESVPEKNEDSVETLIMEYDSRRYRKTDDAASMQAVVCIVLAALFFCVNIYFPEIAGDIFDRLTELSSDKKEVIPNPIDVILSLL